MIEQFKTPNSWYAVIVVTLVGGVVGNFLYRWITAGAAHLSAHARRTLEARRKRKKELLDRISQDPALLASAMSAAAINATVYCVLLIMAIVFATISWLLTSYPTIAATVIKAPGTADHLARGLQWMAMLLAARAMYVQYGAIDRHEMLSEAWRRATGGKQPGRGQALAQLLWVLAVIGAGLYIAIGPRSPHPAAGANPSAAIQAAPSATPLE